MTSENLLIESGQDLGYGQIFATLWRRRFWLVGAFLAVFPLVAFSTLNKETTYTSSLQLLVEPNYQGKRGNAEDQFADSSVQIDYATQLNLMRSTELIQRAVELLVLQYPDISVGEIQGGLSLAQVQEGKTSTKLFQAVYTSNDPLKSQAVLQAMQKVYLDYNLEQQKLRLRNGLAFIDEQLPGVSADVSRAEGELRQFRESENLLDPGSQGTALAGALDNIRAERRALDAQFEEAMARFEELQTQVGKSIDNALVATRLSQSERYQALLQQIQVNDLAIAQRSVTYTENDPGLADLNDQRRKLLDLLQIEGRRIVRDLEVTGDSEALLTQGNLSPIDISLVQEYVAARSTLTGLVARDRSLEQTEQRLASQLNEFPSLIAEYNRLQPQVSVKRQSLEELLKARQDLSIELARGGFNWQVTESPKLGYPNSPNATRGLMISVVVALFAGGVAAFMRESLDDAVHTSEQLGQSSELPLLGIIPELPRFELEGVTATADQANTTILAPQIAFSLPFREAVDLIYKNIELLNPLASSIVITSAQPNEGKTTLALGLALSAARSQQRVLLIDADLRRPSLHALLNLENDKGFTDLLEGNFRKARRHKVVLSNCSIDVLTSGAIPNDPVHLLSSGQLRRTLDLLEQRYDQIIIDAPPLTGLVDAVQISSCCRGVVMVGRLHQISQSDLSRTSRILEQLPTIGIVANGSRDLPKAAYTKSITESKFIRYEHPNKDQMQNQESYN